MTSVTRPYFRKPLTLAPDNIHIVTEQARYFADPLNLERDGLPGNLSPLARRILDIAHAALTDPDMREELATRVADINNLLAIWPDLQARKKSKEHGAKGGRKSKRTLWAEETAKKLASKDLHSGEAAWRTLPPAHPEDHRCKVETPDDGEFCVFRDGSKLSAENQSTGSIDSLAKRTFIDKYYRPLKVSQ